MKKRLQTRWLFCARALAMAGLLVCSLAFAQNHGSTSFADEQSQPDKQRPVPEAFPEKPSIPPAFQIPVESLGFSSPSANYLGMRVSMASLDFLDEDRLLFTFRVPGLMHREAGDSWSSEERQIRAVVVGLPSGVIQAEALWPLHDRLRYLWMLKDGHFLVRDRDGLLEGTATLELKPYLHFPGPLLSVSTDPTKQYLVTNSREPAAPQQGDGQSTGRGLSDRDPSGSASGSASASITADGQDEGGLTDLVVRILRRDSGKVMLVSRVRTAVHLPINSDGYVEGLRGSGSQWVVNLDYFSGGSRILGNVDSGCSPFYDFVSQREILVTTCGLGGGDKLVAMDTDGHRLWEDQTPLNWAWPIVVNSPDGSRLARETLVVTHPINAYAPLDQADIKGQLVKVFDAATGRVALAAPASPVLDGGGNVAISPSGRRVAVLNAGSIQVFELPSPPPLPGTSQNEPAH
jgi:hypothetical protein